MVETIYLNAADRSLPVQVDREGKVVSLSFKWSRSPAFKVLLDEVKNLKGARWHPADCETCKPCKHPKTWTVTDCTRNRLQLELLQGRLPKELVRYETPLSDEAPRRQLWEHQVAMFRHGITRRRCVFAAEPGCGKTLAAIEVMEWAAKRGFTNWWFVSPKNVQMAWSLEAEKWECLVHPRLVHYDVLATELEAKFRCRRCGNVAPDSKTWIEDLERGGRCRECREVFEDHAEGFEALPPQTAPHGVIMDESAFVKSPGARRTKAAMLLADAVREEHDGFVIEMSGIPAPKDPCDWWSQAEIACPGFLREVSIGHLRRRLAVIETMQGPTHAFPKIVAWRRDEVELLKRRLDGLVQVHLAKDCLDLPELRKEVVHLPPSPEMLRAAKLVANTSRTAVEALNRLRQLSDGFQYRADAPAERATTPKDGALRDLLGRCEEVGRVIVYAGYHESVDHCTRICREAGWTVLQCDGRGWKLEGTPESWNEKQLLKELDRKEDTGEVERLAFVAHPKSGGIGLNLTACPVAIYYSLDFDFSTFGQSLFRGHRPGMDVERGFTAYFLCHLSTDKYVLENLEKKKAMQAWTLDEIKAVLT